MCRCRGAASWDADGDTGMRSTRKGLWLRRGVDGVMGKTACRVDGCWLRAGGANNGKQGSIPLHNLVDWLPWRIIWNLLSITNRSTVRLADLSREHCAQKQ
jgi:hypothetical protein